MLADFKIDRFISQVGIYPETVILDGLRYGQGIFRLVLGNRGHHNLNRGQPQRERSGMMLDDNAYETLQRTQDGPVQHHRRLFFAVVVHVLGAQPARHGEVRLYGAALPYAADAVLQGKIDLGPVECAFTRLQFPFHPRGIDRLFQGLLGLVPGRVVTDAVFRAGRQLHDHLAETEITVNLEQQVDKTGHLGLDLVLGAEDVGIVLGKPPHPHQSVQGPGGFVPVAGAEFRKA